MGKVYESPELRCETLNVGVYGDYGSDDNGGGGNGGGGWGSFIGFFNPLFGLCCGGGGG